MIIRALTTWIWLVDFETKARALDATNELSSDVAAALERHFSFVHVLRNDETSLASVRESRVASGLPSSAMSIGRPDSASGLGAGTFDCIMLHDAIVSAGDDAASVLRGAHRLLRPGGWLQVASPYPPLRGAVEGSGWPRRRLERELNEAGFGEIRTYHVDSSLDRLLHFVPGTRRAIVEYESSPAMRSVTSRRRRLAATLGFPSLLYQGYMLLARA